MVVFQTACGQTDTARSGNKTPGNIEAKSSDYPGLKIQAEEMNKAMLGGDYEKAAGYFYPKLVVQAGGKEKIAAALKDQFAQMKTENFEIISVEVGDPKQVVKIDNEIFAVLPVLSTMKTSDKKATGESSLVGISSDEGKNWTFIDGVNQERFKQMFPKAAEKIQIPVGQLPKTIEN